MEFAGRWIPRELGTELLLLWVIGVVICAVIMHWLGRKRPSDDASRRRSKPPSAHRRRGHRRR